MVRIIILWGVLLFVFQTIITALFQFLGALLFAWDSGYYLAIPLGYASNYFSGYKSMQSVYKIQGLEKTKNLVWGGFWVGFVAMILDMSFGYLLTGQFKIGGVLIPFVTAFGGKLAAPSKK